MSNSKRDRKPSAVRNNQRPGALFVILCVVISLAGLQSRGSDAPSGQTSCLLIVPSRPRVLQLYFDLVQMRKVTLVSYRSNVVSAEPVIHIWTGNKWQPVGFDDFCSLRFVKPAPDIAIVVGDEQTVTQTLLPGMNWPCKIARAQAVDINGLVHEFDPYFRFNAREWKRLADSYGLQLKDENVPPAQPSQKTNVFQQDKRDTPPAVPTENSAAAVSDKQILPAASQSRKPDNKFRLHLGEDEDILFVWIAPLSIWVGREEVTNAQYRWFNRAHDPKRYYDHILNLPDQPATSVSWEDANNYCRWLNRNFNSQLPPGFACRLPTEQEWTAFAAGGREVKYPWGNSWPPPDSFNYKGTEGASIFYSIFHNETFIRGHHDGFIVAAPVNKSGSNAWGLYGVGGNVWEWCQDWSDETKTTRVLKGAAWNNYEPAILAITNRSGALPEKSNPMIGFRVVIAPQK